MSPVAEDRLPCGARVDELLDQVAEGRSDAVLGNPVTAVAWLARKVASFGVRLEAGHVILPGSVHRAIDVAPGDDFTAEFDGLGHVNLSFV